MASSNRTIRRATIGDAARLAAFAERTFRETFETENTRANMDSHCAKNYGRDIQAAEISDPNRFTLISTEDDELIGYAQLRWGPAPDGVKANAPGEIQRLYVAKGRHGAGVAHELMAPCLAEAIARGSDVVWLGVWERNPRAIAFYRKFGFAEVGAHDFTLGTDRQRDIVMARMCELVIR